MKFKVGDRVRNTCVAGDGTPGGMSGKVIRVDEDGERIAVEFPNFDNGHDADEGDGAGNRWWFFKGRVWDGMDNLVLVNDVSDIEDTELKLLGEIVSRFTKLPGPSAERRVLDFLYSRYYGSF